MTAATAVLGAAQILAQSGPGVQASLRGVSAVSSQVIWASGSGGTWLRTTDGGAAWQSGRVDGAARLDFRGVRAFSDRDAILMSSGPGEQSRIYRTGDGGAHWSLLFKNPDAKGFFDCIAFWNTRRGILIGDAVDGHMTVFTTADAGDHWVRRRTHDAALPKEGAFAASNSCVAVSGAREAWFVTGGPGAARVFHSKDGGESWRAALTPLRNDGASAGGFSIAFRDSKHGIAVGGDYSKDTETRGNAAVTGDGGKTWTAPRGTPPNGYRSAVAYLPARKLWIATGTSGSDSSADDGETWRRFDDRSLHALSGNWAAGGKGLIGILSPP